MDHTGDDRRSGITAMRLEQDIGLDADRAELLGHEKTILIICDNDRPSENLRMADATDRLLKRRTWAEQAQKLLRQSLP